MTVYLDLLMALNFLVDFLLILGTNRLAGFPPGFLRAAWASGLGAGYAALCALPRLHFLGSPLWRLVFLSLMGITAFGFNKSAWKRTGIFLLLSLALGGLAVSRGRMQFWGLLLAALGIWALSRMSFGSGVGSREYIPVTVREGDRSISVIALKDTGNGLHDPITGEQVLVLGPREARALLDLTEGQLQNPLQTMLHVSGLRLIPYSSVGQGAGMLLGRRFSQVKQGGRTGAAIVAFAPEPIGRGEMYQALAGGNI